MRARERCERKRNRRRAGVEEMRAGEGEMQERERMWERL